MNERTERKVALWLPIIAPIVIGGLAWYITTQTTNAIAAERFTALSVRVEEIRTNAYERDRQTSALLERMGRVESDVSWLRAWAERQP